MLQKARRAWTRAGTVMGRAAAGGRSLERPFEQSRQSEKVPQIHNVYVTCKKCYRMTIAPNRFMYYLALFFFFVLARNIHYLLTINVPKVARFSNIDLAFLFIFQ